MINPEPLVYTLPRQIIEKDTQADNLYPRTRQFEEIKSACTFFISTIGALFFESREQTDCSSRISIFCPNGPREISLGLFYLHKASSLQGISNPTVTCSQHLS